MIDGSPVDAPEGNTPFIIIPLTQGYEAIVDFEDADLAQLKWYVTCGRYAMRHPRIPGSRTGRLVVLKGVRRLTASTWEARVNERIIGYYDTAEDASFAYDKAALEEYGEFAHLNHPIDQVLAWNAPPRQFGKKSANGYRGVQAVGDRWQAQITHQKRRIPLGFYDTADEAGFAYDKAALELYGVKEQLNHPLEQVQAWTPPERLLRKTNTSGFRGVKKIGKRWSATLHTSGKLIHLGMFDAPEEAARIYDQAALEAYGKSAILNFPKKEYEISRIILRSPSLYS